MEPVGGGLLEPGDKILQRRVVLEQRPATKGLNGGLGWSQAPKGLLQSSSNGWLQWRLVMKSDDGGSRWRLVMPEGCDEARL